MTTSDEPTTHQPAGVSRRGVLGTSAAAAAAAPAVLRPAPAAGATADGAASGPSTVAVRLRVNGKPERVRVDTRATLLDTLREQLGLTGTKKGCDRGQCGACTVHLDGRRVLSCLTLAASVDGEDVTTIEGVEGAFRLHPVQQAFLDHDGFQCGFCTSGQVMSAIAVLDEGPLGSDDEVREAMSGNICRCSAYPGIVAALRAAEQGRGRS